MTKNNARCALCLGRLRARVGVITKEHAPKERAQVPGGGAVLIFMLSRAYPLTLSLLPALASGHGAVITPRSRNSVDYLVGINTPKDWDGDWECTNISSNGQGCHNGQAAFYYSQGCFIGCKECDHLSGRRQVDLCGSGKPRAIDPKYRTLNRNATPGSDLDIYRHNPWAAPGTAPVADACGLAGGTPWPQEVSEAGDYTTTAYAHHGMKGTDLRPLPTGVKWKVGGVAEVTWQIENHHGGGYQYRLCPASEPLTEACFQRTPLAFDTEQQGIVFKVLGLGLGLGVGLGIGLGLGLGLGLGCGPHASTRYSAEAGGRFHPTAS